MDQEAIFCKRCGKVTENVEKLRCIICGVCRWVKKYT